jgi:RNA polymerase sigma-70 factor (ECF subfamily)
MALNTRIYAHRTCADNGHSPPPRRQNEIASQSGARAATNPVMPRAPKNAEPMAVTRQSLIARLNDWGDSRKWQEFFDTYWQLIHSVAMRAGLRDDEAQEVVQETCIAVAKNVGGYDSKLGSFKSWLLQMARWRITDQFRKRDKRRSPRGEDDTRATGTLDRIPGAGAAAFTAMWDEEWQRHVLGVALSRVKRRVEARHYQIFDCVVLKQWTAAKTAKELGANIAQVYLVKHRLKTMLKKELAEIER